MSQQKFDPFTVGLSEAEKDDLEKMIGEFRRKQSENAQGEASQPFQSQIDNLTRRLADLSQMVLTIDRQMEPLVAVMRLLNQKSELLNQRLDDVIEALKKGRML
jgi:ABC-type transporter Mla subunit MlaD